MYYGGRREALKKKNIFSVFGFIFIVWACSFFTVSSTAGELDLLPMGARVHVSEQNLLLELEQDDHLLATGEDQEETTFQQTFLVLNIEQGQDLILSSYREPELQDYVIDFFRDLVRSQEIAEVILANACAFDIPPALAFSLCAEESNYHPRAFNRNRNETVDRGLFQLNSASFPHLTDEEFYDIEINTRHGLAYLRRCFNLAGTEVAALAMYNAGAARVSSAGTPQSTLNYISRILRRQRSIEEQFMAKYARIIQKRSVEIESCYEPIEPMPFRLSLLAPLGR